jgi:hypothetical protein
MQLRLSIVSLTTGAIYLLPCLSNLSASHADATPLQTLGCPVCPEL